MHHLKHHATKVPSDLYAPIFMWNFAAHSNKRNELRSRPGQTENAFARSQLFKGLSSMPSGGLKIQFSSALNSKIQLQFIEMNQLTGCRIPVLFLWANDKKDRVGPENIQYFSVLTLVQEPMRRPH